MSGFTKYSLSRSPALARKTIATKPVLGTATLVMSSTWVGGITPTAEAAWTTLGAKMRSAVA